MSDQNIMESLFKCILTELKASNRCDFLQPFLTDVCLRVLQKLNTCINRKYRTFRKQTFVKFHTMLEDSVGSAVKHLVYAEHLLSCQQMSPLHDNTTCTCSAVHGQGISCRKLFPRQRCHCIYLL